MSPTAFRLSCLVIVLVAHIPTTGSALINFNYYSSAISVAFGVALFGADFVAPMALREKGFRAVGYFLVMLSLIAAIGDNLGNRSTGDTAAANAARRLAQIDAGISKLSAASDDALRQAVAAAEAKVSAAETAANAELSNYRRERDGAERLAKLETEGGEVNGVIYSACPVKPSHSDFETRCPNAYGATRRARTAQSDLETAERLALAKLEDLRAAVTDARKALEGGPKQRAARLRELEQERASIASLAAGASNEVSALASVTGLEAETVRLTLAILAGFGVVALGVAAPMIGFIWICRLPPPRKPKPPRRGDTTIRKRQVNTPKASSASPPETTRLHEEPATSGADVLPLAPLGMSPRERAEWRRHRIAFLDENEPGLKNAEIARRIGSTARTVQNLRKQVKQRQANGEQFHISLHPQLPAAQGAPSLQKTLDASPVASAEAAAV